MGLRSQVFGSSSSRRGYTLAELLMVLSIAGIMVAIAVPRAVHLLDRIAVSAASSDVQATLALARSLALAGGTPVAVDIDSLTGTLRIRRSADSLLSRGVGHAHGVQLSSTRDSLTFDPRGLGRGAANLSVIIRRGSAVETVFVSRLGRVR